MSKKKKSTFDEIQKEQWFQDVRELFVNAVVPIAMSPILESGEITPENVDQCADTIENLMRRCFPSASLLPPEARARVDKACKEAKNRLRRDMFPGLYQ